MNLIRYFTLGSAGYSKAVVQNVPAGCVPTVLLKSYNKRGQVEDFKGDPWKATKSYYDQPKFNNGIFIVGLWRDSHDFQEKDIDLVVAQAKKLNAMHRGKIIYFMPFLEHTQTAKFMDKVFARLQAVAPLLRLVNNPANYGGKTGEYVPGMLNEQHLTARPKGQKPLESLMIYCFDGVNAFDADFQGSFHSQGWKKAHMRSVWIAGFNRRLNTDDTTARPNRVHKPVEKDWESLDYNINNESGGSNLKKDELYKSHADRHAPGRADKRAGIPVFIIPQKGKKLEIRDSTGEKVFTCKYDKIYKDKKRHVYRPVTSAWGHEYCVKLLKQGKPTRCKLYLDGKYIGDLDPAYRAGDFRTS